MTTAVVVADWIKRIADAERERDAVRAGEEHATARKADLVRLHARRLLDDLHAAIVRDVEAFRNEFPGDAARDIRVEATAPEGSFVVRKPAPAAVSLTVEANLQSAALGCHYRFTPTNGLPPREDRFELAFAGEAGQTLLIKHHGTGQVFVAADTLSEFLLGPVFTGRPR
jgi:hypothetical protein